MKKNSKLSKYINMHTILLLVFIIFVLCIFFKFKNWGIFISREEIEQLEGKYEDTFDMILPLIKDSEDASDDGVLTIVTFGNAPFADDRNSSNNLANIIAQKSGATVYNCSIGNSYMSSQNYYFDDASDPLDAYSFYWLATLAATRANEGYYEKAAKSLGDEVPPEADEVFNTLTTLDFNTVDVCVIMYDASDYLIGRNMYSDENSTDITCFTGNMEAGIELFQQYYPNMRIIVLSPTYAFADVNGEYISSDIYRIGKQDVLSTYVIKQFGSCANRCVTFVDNLYGTINEDNAKQYLKDNLHLNVNGRKLVADRFMYALTLYDE